MGRVGDGWDIFPGLGPVSPFQPASRTPGPGLMIPGNGGILVGEAFLTRFWRQTHSPFSIPVGGTGGNWARASWGPLGVGRRTRSSLRPLVWHWPHFPRPKGESGQGFPTGIPPNLPAGFRAWGRLKRRPAVSVIRLTAGTWVLGALAGLSFPARVRASLTFGTPGGRPGGPRGAPFALGGRQPGPGTAVARANRGSPG